MHGAPKKPRTSPATSPRLEQPSAFLTNGSQRTGALSPARISAFAEPLADNLKAITAAINSNLALIAVGISESVLCSTVVATLMASVVVLFASIALFRLRCGAICYSRYP